MSNRYSQAIQRAVEGELRTCTEANANQVTRVALCYVLSRYGACAVTPPADNSDTKSTNYIALSVLGWE